ncbi:MAG: hypothetical protein ABI560_16020 [Myxococcales bacterium]
MLVLLGFSAFPRPAQADDAATVAVINGDAPGPTPVARSRSQQSQGAAPLGPPSVEIIAGHTATVLTQPNLGRSVEQQAQFVSHVPSYLRAIAMDAEQRWSQAAGLYQQALIEVGATVRFDSDLLWEQATFKIDLERRRSQVLARAGGESWGHGGDRRIGAPRGGATPGLTAIERGRLLRLKLMSVRAATGTVPGGLLSATVGALQTALRQPRTAAETAIDVAPRPRLQSAANAAAPSPAAPSPRMRLEPEGGARPEGGRRRGGDPEVRLLLCATRAIAGDRLGARLELAHVAEADRSDPMRALVMATCQAALGYREPALGSLAVAVHRLGPSSRFLPDQTRELQTANDWDVLRLAPLFDRIFR